MNKQFEMVWTVQPQTVNKVKNDLHKVVQDLHKVEQGHSTDFVSI